MKPVRITLALATGVGIAVVAYLAGRHSAQPPSYETNTPRILYYRDPMHPSYHADKPGTAPDCGMRLEPVYAGNEGLVSSQAPGLTNTFHISPGRQRLIAYRPWLFLGYRMESRSAGSIRPER